MEEKFSKFGFVTQLINDSSENPENKKQHKNENGRRSTLKKRSRKKKKYIKK